MRPAGGKRPRLGFLGAGWIGRQRLQSVHRSGVATVAAVSDLSPALAAEAAAVADAFVAPSLEALLDLDLDGLVIATPSALHASQCLAALERGLAVFCQKPLGRTAREVGAVVEAARRADRLLGVDLCYRNAHAMQAVRELVQSGRVGHVFSGDLTFHNAYGPDKPWFYDRAHSGGGCVIDLGIHLVDLALWTLGFPEVRGVSSRLYAQGAALAPQAEEVEDFAEARLDLEGGISVRLACSWRLPAGVDCVLEAAFYGTEGGARLRNVGGSFYELQAELLRGTTREVLSAGPDEWGGRTIVDWAWRLGTGERFSEQSDELVRVADALDAIYRRQPERAPVLRRRGQPAAPARQL